MAPGCNTVVLNMARGVVHNITKFVEMFRTFNLGDTKPTGIDFFLLADKILVALLQKGV
jgi:hypothetical protein